MNGYGKSIVSAGIAGLLAGAGAMLAAAQTGPVNGNVWLVAACVALIAGGKDLQAFLAQSPRHGGSE